MFRFPQPLKGRVQCVVSEEDQVVGCNETSAVSNEMPIVMWQTLGQMIDNSVVDDRIPQLNGNNNANSIITTTAATACASNTTLHQMSRRKSELAQRVTVPGPNDVLCGRGSAANNHIGNRRFRNFVKNFETKYHNSCKADKSFIALQIVLHIQAQTSPPGRFLMKLPPSQAGGCGDTDVWYEIDAIKASKKVSQRLREKKVVSAVAAAAKKETETKFGEPSDSCQQDDEKDCHKLGNEILDEPVIELASAARPQKVCSQPESTSSLWSTFCPPLMPVVVATTTDDAVVESSSITATAVAEALPEAAAVVIDEDFTSNTMEDLPPAADLLEDVFDM